MEITTIHKETAHAGTEGLTDLRVSLRPVRTADLPILQVWDADPVIVELMGRRFDEQTPENWLSSLRGQRTSRAWMIEYKSQTVGELELAQINRRSGTAEIRICIGEKAYWGLGIGTEAMAHSLTFAFGEMNLKTVYLRVFATNRRAVRLYERLGFRKEAVLAPSSRRQDPAPVLLMNLTSQRWANRQAAIAG